MTDAEKIQEYLKIQERLINAGYVVETTRKFVVQKIELATNKSEFTMFYDTIEEFIAAAEVFLLFASRQTARDLEYLKKDTKKTTIIN